MSQQRSDHSSHIVFLCHKFQLDYQTLSSSGLRNQNPPGCTTRYVVFDTILWIGAPHLCIGSRGTDASDGRLTHFKLPPAIALQSLVWLSRAVILASTIAKYFDCIRCFKLQEDMPLAAAMSPG